MIILGVLLFSAGLLAVFKFSYFNSPRMMAARILDPTKAAAGCILIAPDVPFDAEEERPKLMDRVFLINRDGRVVHSWKTEWPVKTPRLDAEGNLWVAQGIPWIGDGQPKLDKLDKNSNVLWSKSIPQLHHDFELLEGGKRVAYAERYPLLPEIIPSAYKSHTPFKPWAGERIVEIDTGTGETLRSFTLESLLPREEPNEAQLKSGDIFHLNSIRYVNSNPLNSHPAWLVSLRNISQIALLEMTGELIWISPKWAFSYPHDATMLENGDILVFNNGRDRNYSTVDQWSLKSQNLVWQYKSKFKYELYSHYQGSAQRLNNGNTLIANSFMGYIFEISGAGEIIQDFINPFFKNEKSLSWPFSPVFRVRKYNSDEVDFTRLGVQCP